MWLVGSARTRAGGFELRRGGFNRCIHVLHERRYTILAYLLSICSPRLSVNTIPVLAAQLTYQAPVRAHQKCPLGGRPRQPD
jgi:hypothetical protein